MVQGASNKPKTKENQFLNPWDAATVAAYLKDSMTQGKIEMDEMEKPLVYPTFGIDLQSNPIKFFGSANPMPLTIVDGATPTNKANVSQPNVSMGTIGNALQVMALQYVYNAGTVNFLELVRTPNKWFNALISANGSTAIWTSAATKKARLMGWRATIVSGTTAAAACKLEILDVAADTGIGVQICGAALGAVPYSTIIANETFGPNGYLMAAANTAININLSSALAVAGVHVQVWGAEE